MTSDSAIVTEFDVITATLPDRRRTAGPDGGRPRPCRAAASRARARWRSSRYHRRPAPPDRAGPFAGDPSPVRARPVASRPPEPATITPELQTWLSTRPAPPPAAHVRARLEREAHQARGAAAAESSRARALLEPQRLLRAGIALGGLRGAGLRNAREVRAVRRTLEVPGLPPAFAGFRVLHVSDPHFGADPGIDAAIVARAAGIEHDLCVLTGDYRYRSVGPTGAALDGLGRLRDALDTDMLAVLGNHDALGMVPPMEAMGIDVLLNECRTRREGPAALHVVGVDDPRYYRLDDLERALSGRSAAPAPGGTSSGAPEGAAALTAHASRTPPPGSAREAATLVLAHSPELGDAASDAGCGAYLCGHTHGGQVCLPNGTPLVRNARAPLERLSGAWRIGAMRGYTSRGAGVSIAAVRFFCPAEITLHTLRPARDA